MSLREFGFDQLDEAALQSLVDNQVRESLTLDFKETLPDKSDKGKREFLKDVTAFANADGGDLLFGVEEDDGVATGLPGVAPASLDTEVQRLASLLRDAVDPRLHGLNIRVVSLASGTDVLHVRVPRSLEAPHMVQLGKYRQFFTRNPSGNHPMSTSEVRQAVLRSADWKERAEAWRRERAALVSRNEAPCLLFGEGQLVVHVVSMMSKGLDLSNEQLKSALTRVAPSGAGGWDHRITYDGFLVATELPGNGEPNIWYRLWFVDGRVEYVFSGLVAANEQSGQRQVRGLRIDLQIEEAVRMTFQPAGAGLPEPPFLVMVSLMGVNGATMLLQNDWFADFQPTPFDRPDFLVPPLFFEEMPTDWWVALAPAINRLWQGAGKSRSPWLNPDGTRRQQR